MVEEKKNRRNIIKDIAFRVAKAAVKATLVYLLYFVAAPLLMPFLSMLPGFAETVEVFVAIFIVLMILGDLTERTIFHHFFTAARALFVIGYLVFSVGDGVISLPLDNFVLTVNLGVFYTFAALLSLLGLAKSVMEAIYFMSERAESGMKP